MKSPLILAAGLCLTLGACTDIDRIVGDNPHGNPNGDVYAGGPGSTYDAKATPAQANGVSKYDPYAPLPAGTAPTDNIIPMATPPVAAPAPTPRHQL